MELAGYALTLCALLVALLPAAGWLVGSFVRYTWIHAGHHSLRRGHTVITEYSPPQQLRPAEIAYLYDQSFGKEELLATIFDLEQRGNIIIRPYNTQHTEPDFALQVVGKATTPDMNNYEQEVLLAIIAMKPQATWGILSTDNKFWNTGFERELEQDLRQKGFFSMDTDETLRKRIAWTTAAALTFVGTVVPTLADRSNFSDPGFATFDQELNIFVAVLLWIPSLLLLGISLRYASVMYRRARNMEHGTAQLRHLWPVIEGYREYVALVELDNVQFESESDHTQARNRILPYAVALNLSTRWQDRFKK